MITEQVQAARRRAFADSKNRASPADRIAQIIAVARSWDDAPGDRQDLPPPRGGWARCFEAAASRGFHPRSVVDLED